MTVKITRTGTLKIVSSGYDDRYVSSECWANIRDDELNITFRVDLDDAAIAYLRLSGIDTTREAIMDAAKTVRASKFTTFITAESTTEFGYKTTTFATTSERINAGIAVCTGYPRLNDVGRAEADRKSADLTADEWQAIYTGLDRVNRDHARRGKPIVEYQQQGHEV